MRGSVKKNVTWLVAGAVDVTENFRWYCCCTVILHDRHELSTERDRQTDTAEHKTQGLKTGIAELT